MTALCFHTHEEAKSRPQTHPNKQGALQKLTRG